MNSILNWLHVEKLDCAFFYEPNPLKNLTSSGLKLEWEMPSRGLPDHGPLFPSDYQRRSFFFSQATVLEDFSDQALTELTFLISAASEMVADIPETITQLDEQCLSS